MIFGTPIWLWLGLAAVIPVLIHLWNKRSGRPRLLGTFRFLPEESFAPAKRIELHEIPLMLVRILMVVLFALLLAGLFLEEEVEGVERVMISETSSEEPFTEEMEGGSLSVSVSSKEIEQKGWWNVLGQIEYRWQPERITIKGDLSEANFRGDRPAFRAVVDWEPVDSLYTDELILAAWELPDEQYRTLIQCRTEVGIQMFIEEMTLSEIQNHEIEILKEPSLILNSENNEAVKLGLQYAADVWEIEAVEQSISELARLELGEQTIRLVQEIKERGVEGMIEANRMFGFSLSVKEMRIDAQPETEIVVTQNENIPFIYTDIYGDLVVNGSVEKELQGWVYAMIANRLIADALGASEILTPELIEGQRNSFTVPSSGKASDAPAEQRSARLWLMGLLALCWLTERWLAPRRGM